MATENKKKRHHATWAYEDSRLRIRQEKALENLQKRLEWKDLTIIHLSKYFRKHVKSELNTADRKYYKALVQEQIDILKKKLERKRR